MFGIAGDWKAGSTTVEAEVWVETVMEGGRRFMAALRKEEAHAARHPQENREATRLEKLLPYRTWKRRNCEATPIDWSSRRAEGILYGHETDRDLRSASACRYVT